MQFPQHAQQLQEVSFSKHSSSDHSSRLTSFWNFLMHGRLPKCSSDRCTFRFGLPDCASCSKATCIKTTGDIVYLGWAMLRDGRLSPTVLLQPQEARQQRELSHGSDNSRTGYEEIRTGHVRGGSFANMLLAFIRVRTKY